MVVQPTLAFANPQDGVVSSGSATISSSAHKTTITQTSKKAVIDWKSFDIGANEQTQFVQPSSKSLTLNRINDTKPSDIQGNISANGRVILINPNGVFFSAGSSVDVNGLVATTAGISNSDFMKKKKLDFNIAGNPNSKIVNQGTITAADAGLVGLVAPQVENQGVIKARLGKVHMASGDTFSVDMAGDGLISVAVDQDLHEQIVKNSGTISAYGGEVMMTAAAARKQVNSLIDNTGVIEAKSFANKNGKITLFAAGSHAVANNDATQKGTTPGQSIVRNSGTLDVSGAENKASAGNVEVLADKVTLSSTSVIKAQSGKNGNGGSVKIGGDYQGKGKTPTSYNTYVNEGSFIYAYADGAGNGGRVIVWSDDTTKYAGQIDARGGDLSGKGGFAEVSGHKFLDFTGSAKLTGATGNAGTLLLDPQNITIQTAAGGTGVTCNGSGVCTPDGDTSVLTVAALEAALGAGNVEITTGNNGAQAGDITFANHVTWATPYRLLVNAYRNVTINSGVTISNTYGTLLSGTQAGGTMIPVLLALRADSSGINNGGSFTNSGTIDFSASSGAVSMFYDRTTHGGSYTAGTQTGNANWATNFLPGNKTVSSQFTAYQLVNTANDLYNVSASPYALGKDINGGGGAFNGDASIGVFAGILDGQYCALAGGTKCGITNFTFTAGAGTVAPAMFTSSSSAIRNLRVGMDLTQNTTNSTTTTNKGILVAANTGTIANVDVTGNISITYSGSTSARILNVGGIAGYNNGGTIIGSTFTGNVTGTNFFNNGTPGGTVNMRLGGIAGVMTDGYILNSSSSGNIYGIMKNTTSSSSTFYMGGLVGYNNSTTTNSLTDVSSSSNLSLDWDPGYTSGRVNSYMGGLVGQLGAATATSLLRGSATGTVQSTVSGSNSGHYLGGLVGNFNSSGTVADSYATGNVTYNVTGVIVSASNVGGLIGQAIGGSTVSNSYASGNVVLAGTSTASYLVGGLIGYNTGTVTGSRYLTGTATGHGASITTADTVMMLGGLVGQNDGTISSSWVTGNTVLVNKSTSSHVQIVRVGGLVGWNTSTTADSVNNSYNTGAVSAGNFTGVTTQTTGYIGGLIGISGGAYGSAATATSTTTNYSTGAVANNLTSAASTQYVAGLIAYNNSSSTTSIVNSYTSGAGDVTTTNNGSAYIAGLTAYNGGTIDNSYSTKNVTLTFNGSVSTNLVSAGFVGQNNGTINNSYAQTGEASIINEVSSSVTTFSYLGGYLAFQSGVGSLTGTNTSSGNVTFTYKGTSSGAQTVNIGGFIGMSNDLALSTGSSSGNVTAQYDSASYNTGLINTNIGGFIGNNGNGFASAITGVHSSGNVYDYTGGAGTNHFVGGFIGNNSNTTATVTNSYSTGNVVFDSNASSYVGGFIGYNNPTTGAVTNSYATGNVSATVTTGTSTALMVGGFIGYSLPTGSGANLSGNYSAGGTVTATNVTSGSAIVNMYVGGLVGYLNGTSATLTGSYSKENVNYVYKGSSTAIQSAYVGGLVGYNSAITSTSVSTSYAMGNVTASYDAASSGNKYVSSYMGGLIGQSGNNAATLISTSFSTGNVTSNMQGTGTSQYIGGLVGYNYSNSASSIQNSYAMGGVFYNGNLAGALIGGLVGNSSGGISSSYAAGYVQQATGTEGGVAGGGTYTCTNCYWDADTTGLSSSTGGTSRTTAQLQAALQTGMSSPTWGIVAGISYPYLASIYTATPTVISGTAYSDAGTTALSGAAVSGLINGSILTGGSGTTGANGYYYYLLPTADLGAGAQIMTYLTGATKGQHFRDNVTTNVTMDLYGNYLRMTGASATDKMADLLTRLATAQGGYSGANFTYTANGSGITMTSGYNLHLDLNTGFAIDKTLTTSGGGIVLLNTTTASITQSAAITASNLLLRSTSGTFTLDSTSNNIGTVAAGMGTGTLALNNGSNDLAIGAVSGTNGLTAAAVNLTSTGTVTQSQAISASTLSLLGAAGTYTLTNTSNAISSLAASTGTVNFLEDSGFAINGITADNLYLSTSGTVTQGSPVNDKIIVTNALFSGTGSYSLQNFSNNVGTLAANTGTLSYLGHDNFSIGTVNGVNGVTATNFYLSGGSSGTVTQTQAITATNFYLSGAGHIFTLTNSGNNVTNFAAGTTNVINFRDDTGFAIGTVNGANGIAATGLYLSSTGTVSQSQAITATNLLLQGTGTYGLTNTSNAITTLASSGTATINFLENSGYDIGTVNSVNGLAAANAYLSSTGTVTQAQAITATNLLLSGTNGVYTLTDTGNAITTLAANTGTISFTENSGFDIGTVNSVNGLTGALTTLTTTGTVTQSQAINASTRLLLNGTGGTYTLTNTGNNLVSLGGTTGTAHVYNSASSWAMHNSSFTNLYLNGTGTVSQNINTNILATNLLLQGSGSYTLTPTGTGINTLATLAANMTGTFTVTNTNSNMTVGTVNSVNGITSTGTTIDLGTGVLTTSQAIAVGAGNLTLTADDMVLGANLSGTGTVTLQPTTDSRTMIIGTSGTASQFVLTSAEINRLVDGWSSIIIGKSTGTNPLFTNASLSFSDPTTFRTGGGMQIGSPLIGTGNASFAFQTGAGTSMDSTITTAGGDVTFTTGTYTYWNANSSNITTSGGAVSLGVVRTYGNNGGSGSSISTSGGNISIGTFTSPLANTSGMNYVLNAGSGTVAFGSTVNIDANLAVTGGNLTFNGAWGASAVPGTVSLTSTSSYVLPVITATNLYLSSGGTVTQSGILTATNLNLANTSGIYTLNSYSNVIGTMSANVASVNLTNGNNNLTVGTVNGVNGMTTTGATSLVNAGLITLNQGITAGGPGNSLVLSGTGFDNNAGSGALNAGSGGGRFLVWSTTPLTDDRGGITYSFKQYNATYGTTAVAGTGNGFLYTLAPTVSTSLTGSVTKVYDGTTTATLTGANFGAVTGGIDGDTVSFTNPTSGTYDTKDKGTGKTISVGASTIASATNGAATVYGYQVSAPSGAAIGEITARQLTIGGSFTANNKVYDATTAATFLSNGLTLVGIQNGEDVTLSGTTLAFATANVGTAKTVSINGSALGGTADLGNYTLSLAGAPTALADITHASLQVTISGTFTVHDKIYDGTTTATINSNSLSLVGVQGSDDVNLNAIATFLDKNAGTSKTVTLAGSSLTGLDIGNYTIDFTGAPTTTANIAARALTIGGGFTVNNKVFDGTTAATISSNSLNLSGIQAGEDVTLTAVAGFDTATAGTGKTVSLLGSSLGGTADLNNYILDFAGAPTALANITGGVTPPTVNLSSLILYLATIPTVQMASQPAPILATATVAGPSISNFNTYLNADMATGTEGESYNTMNSVTGLGPSSNDDDSDFDMNCEQRTAGRRDLLNLRNVCF